MTTAKKKRPQASGHGHSTRSRGKIVKIYYAEDETGPAELLGDRLARIIDVPVCTDAFWRDDIVRLAECPPDAFPRIAEVVCTRFARRSLVQFFGGEFVANLLMAIFSLLRCDTAVIMLPTEERAGVISVAHAASFDPCKVVKLLGADKAERTQSTS